MVTQYDNIMQAILIWAKSTYRYFAKLIKYYRQFTSIYLTTSINNKDSNMTFTSSCYEIQAIPVSGMTRFATRIPRNFLAFQTNIRAHRARTFLSALQVLDVVSFQSNRNFSCENFQLSTTIWCYCSVATYQIEMKPTVSDSLPTGSGFCYKQWNAIYLCLCKVLCFLHSGVL